MNRTPKSGHTSVHFLGYGSFCKQGFNFYQFCGFHAMYEHDFRLLKMILAQRWV